MIKYKKMSTYLQSGHSKHLLKCALSKSLTHNFKLWHNKENLKEPYNQGMKVQVNTKDIKNDRRLSIKSSIPEAECNRGVFSNSALYL